MPLVANILQPLNDVEEWVLEGLHGIGLTWGLAIVGLTLLTRLLTLPLASGASGSRSRSGGSRRRRRSRRTPAG